MDAWGRREAQHDQYARRVALRVVSVAPAGIQMIKSAIPNSTGVIISDEDDGDAP